MCLYTGDGTLPSDDVCARHAGDTVRRYGELPSLELSFESCYGVRTRMRAHTRAHTHTHTHTYSYILYVEGQLVINWYKY
jgi:hypothetical protein